MGDEYSVQFFGFTAKEFTDAMFNMMEECLADTVEEVLFEGLQTSKQFMQQSTNVQSEKGASNSNAPVSNDDELNLERRLARHRENCDSFSEEVLASADEAIDKIQVFLSSNVLVVPEHVTLPEDQVQLDSSEWFKGKMSSVDAELNRLEQDLRMVASKIANEERDERRLDSTIDIYEKRLKIVDEVLATAENQLEEVGLEAAVKESTKIATELVTELSKHRDGIK